MIIHRWKLIFIPVRRAAGKSISAALTPYVHHRDDLEEFNLGVMSEPGVDHTPKCGQWSDVAAFYPGYTIATVSRNPFDKLVSAYWYSDQGARFLGEKVTFNEWIHRLPRKEENGRWWLHTAARQTDFVVGPGGMVADYVVKYEDLAATWRELFKEVLDVDQVPDLGHVDQTPRPDGQVDAMFKDTDVLSWTVKHFQADFSLYGYSTKPPRMKGSV